MRSISSSCGKMLESMGNTQQAVDELFFDKEDRTRIEHGKLWLLFWPNQGRHMFSSHGLWELTPERHHTIEQEPSFRSRYICSRQTDNIFALEMDSSTFQNSKCDGRVSQLMRSQLSKRGTLHRWIYVSIDMRQTKSLVEESVGLSIAGRSSTSRDCRHWSFPTAAAKNIT